VSEQVRLLLVHSDSRAPSPASMLDRACVEHSATLGEAIDRLSSEAFEALLIDLGDPRVADALRTLHQAGHILAHVADGIAVIDADSRIRWANPTFTSWCAADPVGQLFHQALGADEPILANRLLDADQKPGSLIHLLARGDRYIDFHLTPLPDQPANPLFVVLGHDVSSVVHKQQKLAALSLAMDELTAMDSGVLADMNPEERIELLKKNIRRLVRDLLHFEIVEIRLLDAVTGRLEVLIQDGIPPDVPGKELYARTEGNGLTGYVAATGNSYLCRDTRVDPLFLPGAPDTRSSLTVPLRYRERIIGTFNVESPQVAAFTEEDRQFAETFCHAIAAALHTLELLHVEKITAATRSIEAVQKEVALPTDDILADAAWVLDRYVGHEAELAERLRNILANARLIKQSIQQVGEQLTPRPLPSIVSEPAPPELKGRRVLVVDRDDPVRKSAHLLIGRWGGIVETARDGQEALTLARLARYDAILADIRLPDLSGYEVYRALRQAQPEARVILMTGYGYDPGHSLVKARQEGLKYVLFKPFRVDQLRTALSELGKNDSAA
jgi:CheY-like chemotaxis protein/GAF domain-containing protein